ncbi:protein of unknown function (plasmid) [Pararobbsia alpina]
MTGQLLPQERHSLDRLQTTPAQTRLASARLGLDFDNPSLSTRHSTADDQVSLTVKPVVDSFNKNPNNSLPPAHTSARLRTSVLGPDYLAFLQFPIGACSTVVNCLAVSRCTTLDRRRQREGPRHGDEVRL